MMQQNRDRNGRPRNTRPYDLNRDVARTSAPSQDHTPRSTGSSRYGYNGEPLSRPPSRSANGSVRSSRADNSIQFPTQSQPRRPAQGQGSNTTQYPAGNRPAGSRPKNAKSGGKQRRPANNARSGQSSRKNQNAQNRPNRQHPAGSQSAPQQSPARREMRKKRKVTRATLRRRRMLRRLTAFAMLLCVIGAGIYLTMTMLFRINSIQVQTPDGKQFSLGSGLTAQMRKSPPALGSWVTYRYQGLHEKSGLPRFARRAVCFCQEGCSDHGGEQLQLRRTQIQLAPGTGIGVRLTEGLRAGPVLKRAF